MDRAEPIQAAFSPLNFSPMSGTLFFSEHLNWQVLSLFRLQLFSTRVLDIHLGGLKAACIGLDVSKFRPSVGDGATLWAPLRVVAGAGGALRHAVVGQPLCPCQEGDASHLRCAAACPPPLHGADGCLDCPLVRFTPPRASVVGCQVRPPRLHVWRPVLPGVEVSVVVGIEGPFWWSCGIALCLLPVGMDGF